MNYVAISGGADSTAMALLLNEQGLDFKLIFADTGAEFPENYLINTMLAREIGKELIVVNNGTFYQHLVKFGYFLPAIKQRWCTRILKNIPQNKVIKNEDFVYVGIRYDESHRAREGNKVYPLITAEMTKKEVKNLCKKYDLLNPVYKWRTNVSCFCCPLQKKSDWIGLLDNYPSLYWLAERWELESIRLAEEKGYKPHYWRSDGLHLSTLRRMHKGQYVLL